MIHHLQGDATHPQRDPPWIIAHIVNTRGGWGKGFVLAVSKRWEEPESYYRNWYRIGDEMDGTPFELGYTQLIPVGPGQWVSNMLAQQGYRSRTNPVPVDYLALRQCLAYLAADAKRLGAAVHMPRIGSGNGGGSWVTIERLIKEELQGIEVFVYGL